MIYLLRSEEILCIGLTKAFTDTPQTVRETSFFNTFKYKMIQTTNQRYKLFGSTLQPLGNKNKRDRV